MRVLIMICATIFILSCGSKDVTVPSLQPGAVLDTSKVITTVAFGSCNKSNAPQPLWQQIVANEPDIWVWLGDIIYGDSEDPEVLRRKYNRQKEKKAYRQLSEKIPVIGIWDDHDYGSNDGDKNYKTKKESQQILFDFLDIPMTDPLRKQEGAYTSYTIGQDSQLIKIILLDGRYFRDTLNPTGKRDGQRYHFNETGDILGEAQWAWFEEELTHSKAKIHIIGCGIQVIPEEHNFEKWANFPLARKRLLDLFNRTKPEGLILLSGDRHIAEISRMSLDSLDYPLYEVTSSGMTHSYEKIKEKKEINKYQVDNLVTGEKNFGLLHIDWSTSPPVVTAEVKGLENKTLLKKILN